MVRTRSEAQQSRLYLFEAILISFLYTCVSCVIMSCDFTDYSHSTSTVIIIFYSTSNQSINFIKTIKNGGVSCEQMAGAVANCL